jgi:hypothetical protein
VAHLAELDWPVADCYLAGHLPARYLPRYTPLLIKRFFACILTVAWKLAQPERHPLTCVAEELALRAIIVEAEGVLAEEDEDADFGAFEDEAYEDTDFEYLFTPAADGIDDSPVGAELGMGSLDLADWLKPFGQGDRGAVHPYVDDGSGECY